MSETAPNLAAICPTCGDPLDAFGECRVRRQVAEMLAAERLARDAAEVERLTRPPKRRWLQVAAR